jgi:hypothetical protein
MSPVHALDQLAADPQRWAAAGAAQTRRIAASLKQNQ